MPRSAILPLLSLLVLAGCQTVPAHRGFTQRQVAVLKANGFEPVGDDWELGMPDRLLFEVDESRLVDQQNGRLNRLARALAEVGIAGAQVEGNTDSTGAARYNVELSARRAKAVREALVAGGMNPAAIRAVGLGEANPIESNATRQGRRENRRVVIIISPSGP